MAKFDKRWAIATADIAYACDNAAGVSSHALQN
jgi:hypothetical protein